MMSANEVNRRGIDDSIHDRRSQITEHDRQLRELKSAGITGGDQRDAILTARSQLSRAQGIDKRFVRGHERMRRQPIPMSRGIAVRVV